MAEFTIAKLADGREVRVDLEKLKAALRTRHDVKRLTGIAPTSDAYDEFLAQVTDISAADLDALELADWLAVDRAVGAAIKTVISVNPN
jgi:uncharacterized membrane-anchored protein